MILESFSILSNSMILRFCSHFGCSLPLQSLKRKGRNVMKCLFNRNNTEFPIFSIQSTKPVWVMINLACFLLRGMSLFTLSVRWAGPGGCFGVRLKQVAQPFTVCFCGSCQCYLPTSSPASWAHSSLELECRNCSGKVALKDLTCLLLSSLLHINTFVSLCLLQFGAKSPWLQWEYIEI